MGELLDKLNLSIREKEMIQNAVKKLDIKSGHWSIRYLEGMQALIEEEIRKRYNQKI